MQIKIDKQYPVAAEMDAAWKVLSDMRELAACMPGAEITEQLDPAHYKGNMKLRVGPASAAFGGDIEVIELNAKDRSIRFKGKGAERGGSSATMELIATLRPGNMADVCLLQGSAEITVSGKFAQFGARMMTSVADLMLDRFTQNFSQKASALSVPAAAESPSTVKSISTASELNAFLLVWEAIVRFFASLMRLRK